MPSVTPIALSLVVSIIGLIIYAITPLANVKVSSVSFAAFWVGLLAFLIDFGGRLVR